MSGGFASYGKFAEMGSKLAVGSYGDVLGGPASYKTIDTEGNAGKAVRKVQEAIQQEGARFFNGVQVIALDIFDNGDFQHFLIGGFG